MILGLLALLAILPWAAPGAAQGKPDSGADAAEEEPIAYTYDLSAYTAYSLEGGVPETNLILGSGASRWKIDKLFQPRDARGYWSLGLSAGGEWDPAGWLSLRTLLSSGEIRDGASLSPKVEGIASNGNRIGDEFGSGSFVYELAAEFLSRGLTVQLGRFRSQVGYGLVYDNFGSGASVKLDLEPLHIGPWESELGVAAVGRRFDDLTSPDPLLFWRLDWDLSWFESLGLFAALFFDRKGELSDLLKYSIAEAAIDPSNPAAATQLALDSIFASEQGNGRLAYLGADGQLNPAKSFSIRAAAALSFGSIRIPYPEGQSTTVQVLGYAGDLELHYSLSQLFDLGLLGFALSGGRPPKSNDLNYRAFIGVAPYWTWSGLFFFTGGVNQAFQPGRATAAGINGHGVLGAGPTLALIRDTFQAELRVIWLRAWTKPPAFLPSHGYNYGVETDLSAELSLTDWLSLGLEADLLAPGDFLPKDRLAYRAFTLVKVSYDR